MEAQVFFLNDFYSFQIVPFFMLNIFAGNQTFFACSGNATPWSWLRKQQEFVDGIVRSIFLLMVAFNSLIGIFYEGIIFVISTT